MHPGSDDSDFKAMAQLAEAFGATVDLLTQGQTQTLSAEALVELAHRCLPRAQHTGLLLREHGRVHAVAASSDMVRRLDDLRESLGEGPALDVLDSNDYVVSDDLSEDPRWPRFGSRAVEELDVRSVACYRLYIGGDHRAALMFLSDWPYAFDESAIAIGAIYAAYCSLVLVTEQLLGDRVSPRRSAEVHREIGVAVGILLAQDGMAADEAYRRLHDASHSLQQTLSEVARHVVTHRRLPSDH